MKANTKNMTSINEENSMVVDNRFDLIFFI